MTEQFSWGVVLKKEPIGESDSEYSVFTWDLGKVRARATGSRKILSRLAGHLEPGTLATVRIARRNAEGNFRMAEALSERKTKSPAVVRVLSFADELLPLEEPDIKIFSFLKDLISNGVKSEADSYATVLALTGFDPKMAKCGICGTEKIAYFSPEDIMFLCAPCLKRKTNSRTNDRKQTIKEQFGR
ncbi:MAG: DNA repair protein RecO [Parcubacteria group bacterium]